MEEVVGTCRRGQAIPLSWVRALIMLAVVLTIITSPVVSTNWATAQTIDDGTESHIGEGAGGEDGIVTQQNPANGGDSANDGKTQRSDVSGGEAADDGTNLGTVNNGDVKDGAEVSTESSTAPQQGEHNEDSTGPQINQEQSTGSSPEQDRDNIDENYDPRGSLPTVREDDAAVRETAVEKRQTIHTFQHSEQLLNSSHVFSSLKQHDTQNSNSTNNIETAQLATESTAQNQFDNSNLLSQNNEQKIRIEAAHTQLQQLPNQTTTQESSSHTQMISNQSGIHEVLSLNNQLQELPNQTTTQESSSHTQMISNQSGIQKADFDSNQNVTQANSPITNQSEIASTQGATLANDSSSVLINEISKSASHPSSNSSNSSFKGLGNESSPNSLPAHSSSENSSLSSSAIHASLLGSTPGSVIEPATGNGTVISLRDIGNTNNATGEASFDKKEYFLGDTPKITVRDDEANLDPNEIEFVTAFVSSDTSQPFSITVQLKETGPNTGVFEGNFVLINGPSSGNTLQVNGTDIITVNYIISHARVKVTLNGFPGPNFTINGVPVSGPTAFEISDALVSISDGSEIQTGIGFEIRASCIDFSACGANFLLTNPVCVENDIPSPEVICNGSRTIEISYANALLGGQNPADLTIWQDMRGFPFDKWVDLSDWGEVIVDESAKTITATSPFGTVGGLFAIGVKIGVGGGGSGAQDFPSAECLSLNDPGGGGGGGGGGGIGFDRGVVCERVPGGVQVLSTTAKDPVVPVLNPLLPRITPSTITPVQSEQQVVKDDTQINILPTALAANDNCDTNSAIQANSTSFSCPKLNYNTNEFVPATTNSTTINRKTGIINASSFNQEGVIWVDADVKNLILEIRPEPKRQDVVIVEGTSLVWVNLNEVKQGIRVLENTTGEKVFSDLSVPSGNFTSFKFMKPGLYEYSNLVDSNISNSGTVQVVSKGEGVDNISTNATTRTVGVTIVPIKEVTSFLSNLNATGSLVLSSNSVPSSADTIYVWSNEGAGSDSILAKLGRLSTN